MTHLPRLAALLFSAALAWPTPAQAGPGHDHGEAAQPSAGAPAQPRFAAASELFELVGVLEGRQLTLYLDRAADNAPVAGAQIELEIAGTKLQATPRDDVYTLTLAAAPAAGLLPVTATVTAGQEIDLLAGELDVHDHAHAEAAPHAHVWAQIGAWAGAVLAALGLLSVLGRRWAARRARRAERAGAAA